MRRQRTIPVAMSTASTSWAFDRKYALVLVGGRTAAAGLWHVPDPARDGLLPDGSGNAPAAQMPKPMRSRERLRDPAHRLDVQSRHHIG